MGQYAFSAETGCAAFLCLALASGDIIYSTTDKLFRRGLDLEPSWINKFAETCIVY